MYGAVSLGGYGLRPYGSLLLVDPQPADYFVEVFTIEDMLSYLKIPVRDPSDELEYAAITSFIAAARRTAEDFQGRDLIKKQWSLTMDYWPQIDMILRIPLISVDSITFKNSSGVTTTAVEGTHYIVDKVRGVVAPLFGQTFPPFTPWPSSAIEAKFTSGMSADSPFWSDAGALVKVGMRLLISEWYSRRLPGDVVEPTTLPGHIMAYLSYGAHTIL